VNYFRLLQETLTHYWRTNLAVLLGALIGSAVLTGSLLVGDSMRGTLHEMTLERLGHVDIVMIGPKFFKQDLPKRLLETQHPDSPSSAAAIILIRGAVTGPNETRASSVQIIGTTPAFWRMFPKTGLDAEEAASKVIVNQSLADQIKLDSNEKPRTRIAVRLEKASDIPREGLLGRREGTIRSVPFSVDQVIPDIGAGRFSLDMTQRMPATLFVPIEKLAGPIEQKGRANALLVTISPNDDGTSKAISRIRNALSLDDLGVELQSEKEWISVGSRERILSDTLVRAVNRLITDEHLPSQHIMTYLANTIALGNKEIPYSVVAGMDYPVEPPLGPIVADPPERYPGPHQVIVNQWTADKLGAKVGDEIRLDYFEVQNDSTLKTKNESFKIIALAPMEGLAIDRRFTPEYPGITDADTFGEWDAPFPVDLDRVKADDEKYWKDYRTAPKVFLSLVDAQRLWSTRFGKLTSIRLVGPKQMADPVEQKDAISRQLRKLLDPEELGFAILPIRETSLSASSGSTDFGMLFVSMSFFLIVSAALLVGLLFRLNTERRSASIGVLMAVGVRPSTVRWLLLAEGFVLASIGSLLGLAGAVLYARSLLKLLSTWWKDAVGTSFIDFHAAPTSFVIGALSSLIIALIAVFWATSRIAKTPIPALFNEGFTFVARSRRRRWLHWVFAAGGLLGGIGLILAGFFGLTSEMGAFFGGGTLLLIGDLALLSAFLHRPALSDPAALVRGAGFIAITRLGIRNASRYPTRSLVTATLLALAVFLVVAVGSMRHGKPPHVPDKNSGNGGFALLATASAPLTRDLSDPEGRFAMNVSDEASELLRNAEIYSFRVKSGDDASCLNIYQPRHPTILGATRSFIDRGGFAFSTTLAASKEEAENPWKLLDKDFGPGVIPAIGDAATLQWILKVPVGSDLEMRTEKGEIVHLRIVGGLNESVFQGQLVVSETAFLKAFPSITGKRFFLIAPSGGSSDKLASLMEKDLSDYGVDVDSTGRVIENYLSVQDTYMAAFQTLGGLGLMLGTLGLAAVLLRNILERRGELALFRAIGFRDTAIAWMVLSETGTLLWAGLLTGTACALIAVLPQLIRIHDWGVMIPLGGTLLVIIFLGFVSGFVAVIAALRSPVLAALRSERA
jgi:ABC-type antimicrobial peptide transport system permease subunit